MSPTRAIIEYTKCAIQHDSHFHNCKYVLMQMWPASQRKPAKKNNQSTIPPPDISSDDPSLPPIHNLAKAKSFRDLCGFVPELTPVLEKYELLRDQRRRALEEHSTLAMSGVENAGPETELGPECPYLPKQEIMLVVDRDRDGRVVDGESLDSEQRKRRKSSVE
ncbi:hypothetical protein HDU82_008453 [Entophlyctis luteolus]|nr:hypothetical protein HDU82_008453 [Entophlyctis luteolus]